MSEYIITVDEDDERWQYVVQQYTHFFGYPISGEIVRCRDCRYSDAIKTRYQQEMVYACLNFDSAAIEPNGYCKWGERRER